MDENIRSALNMAYGRSQGGSSPESVRAES